MQAQADLTSACDPTEAALRAALDRYAAGMAEGVTEHVTHGLVSEVLSCLPDGLFEPVLLPANGTANPRLAISFRPAFRRYVTFAAQYWAELVTAHRSPPQPDLSSEA